MDVKDETESVPTRSLSTNEVIANDTEASPPVQSKSIFSRRVVITLISLYLIGIALICVGGVLIFKLVNQLKSDKPLRTQEYLNFARLNELKGLPVTSLQKATSLILQVDSEDQDIYRFYNVRGVEFIIPKSKSDKSMHTTVFHLSLGHKLIVSEDKATLIDSKDGTIIAEYTEDDAPPHIIDEATDTSSLPVDIPTGSDTVVLDTDSEEDFDSETDSEKLNTEDDEQSQLRTLIKKEYFKPPSHGHGGYGGGYGGYSRGYGGYSRYGGYPNTRYSNYFNSCPYCGMYYGSPWQQGFGGMFGGPMSMFGGLF